MTDQMDDLFYFATLIIIIVFVLCVINYVRDGDCKQFKPDSNLFVYECPLSPNLDYEFNCHNKFTNMTGVYCLDNSTTKLICQNTLK